jgi:hypothetical protein
MHTRSTVGGPRRIGRHKFAGVTLRAVALAGLLAVACLSGYRVGVSQGATEAERLQADLSALHDLNRQLGGRVAASEQQAEVAIARYAQLVQEQRRQAPSAELARLSELAGDRLRAGVPGERLAFVLANAAPASSCSAAIDTRRLVVLTPASKAPGATVAFFDNRVLIGAEGASARTGDGMLQARFDSAQPVRLRFSEIDGGAGTAGGTLPLTHALVVDGQEFRFAVRASERQPDALEISAQRCSFP